MKLFMVDGIGPFFRGYHKKRTNWSKIPFHTFDFCSSRKRQKRLDKITEDVELFAARVKRDGYNAVTLDDVAHLVDHPWYRDEVNLVIKSYQEAYRRYFQIFCTYGLSIFLTMDVLSMTEELKEKVGLDKGLGLNFLEELLLELFQLFPEIEGVILRIGEGDGKDVKGIFRSELLLRSSRDVNSMLKKLLPHFEKQKKKLILRTWTVGAHPVGDLIWHRGRLASILKDIDSKSFILSMKYGESDFFRYLPLNQHFFRHSVRMILELQARREYEGCGEYPSFIGYEYEQFARQLAAADNVIGISVWVQSGGWVPFHRLTYLEERGIWNEINSYVCIKLFRENLSVEEAVAAYAGKTSCQEPEKLLEMLRLSHEVVREVMYIEEVASAKLFFRRVRIPPLLAVYWNNIFINHSIKKILSVLVVEEPEKYIVQGYQGLEKIKRMKDICEELELYPDDIEYMLDTFSLFVHAREYYFLPYDDSLRQRIKEAKRAYKRKYPADTRPRYRVKTDFRPFRLRRYHLKWLFPVIIRRKRGYRLVDHLLIIHGLRLFFKFYVWFRPKGLPKFARKHAMGIETIFK